MRNLILVASLVFLVVGCGKSSSPSSPRVTEGFFAAENFEGADIPLVAVLTKNGVRNLYTVMRVTGSAHKHVSFFRQSYADFGKSPTVMGPGYVANTSGRKVFEIDTEFFFRDGKLIGTGKKQTAAGERARSFRVQYYETTGSEMRAAFRDIVGAWMKGRGSSSADEQRFCRDLFGESCETVVK